MKWRPYFLPPQYPCARKVERGIGFFFFFFLVNWEGSSMVEFLATGEACKVIFWPTPDLKDITFLTLCSQQRSDYFLCPKYPDAKKWKEDSEINQVEYTGKLDIDKVEFLPQDEAFKAVFFITSFLKRQIVWLLRVNYKKVQCLHDLSHVSFEWQIV